MSTSDLTYNRPTSLAAACELGSACGAAGRFLAGGTELLVDLKSGRDTAGHLISLRGVPGLREISLEKDGTLRIGALASLAAVAGSAAVEQTFPVLREAVLQMGGAQIRNLATIGGNFCRAVPCADTPPVCLAGGARLRITGTEGERTLPAAEFFVGPRQTVLQRGEILTEIQIPPQPAGSGVSYQRFQLRGGMALAVAAVAAWVRLAAGKIAEARIVLNSVAPVPLPAVQAAAEVVGGRAAAELFAKAGQIAAREAQPIDDLRGSARFRRELVEVLTRRALREAVTRAEGEVS